MWSQPEDPPNSVGDLSRITRGNGFPDRDFLARRYAERSGRSIDALRWYQVLALWKAAVFLEGSFRRFGAGTTADPFFASLETGVPALAALARERTGN
jgi:aminoglycoside phosphotransferase (APT) family kinase protein